MEARSSRSGSAPRLSSSSAISVSSDSQAMCSGVLSDWATGSSIRLSRDLTDQLPSPYSPDSLRMFGLAPWSSSSAACHHRRHRHRHSTHWMQSGLSNGGPGPQKENITCGMPWPQRVRITGTGTTAPSMCQIMEHTPRSCKTTGTAVLPIGTQRCLYGYTRFASADCVYPSDHPSCGSPNLRKHCRITCATFESPQETTETSAAEVLFTVYGSCQS
mmetsp:Transcript_43333/g.108616  ORF Transcript_43333/g.108616 Transcript_43333/m.108616 type:complete len:217 (-) Transcript_43333:966-1616(-)